ncbi:MAG: hypothetical protein KKH44_07765 [Bacteroidetes bacterium]|nr:hypothetical protein [Bacteroidota bacterium]
MGVRKIMQHFNYIFLICWLCFFLPGVKAQEFNIGEFRMGHYATGELDTVKVEIVINAKNILTVKDGFIEREKYSYAGDRMPNGLPNNGGAYDDYYVTKRYLDENKNEIKEYVWMSRELGKK